MKGIALTIGLLVGLFAGGDRLSRATLADDDPILVPSKMCGVYYLVPVNIGNRELQLLFDTGAFDTYIDPDVLSDALDSKIGKRRTRLKEARAGSFSLDGLTAYHLQMDALALALGTQLDGILGFSAFRDYLLTLDYPTQTIWAEKGRLPKVDNEEVFSARGPDRRPWVKIDLGDRRYTMLIDSGSGDIMSLKSLKNVETIEDPILSSIAQRFDKTQYNRVARASNDLMIGRHVIETPIISEVSDLQILSGQLMRHFSITFDQRKRRVRFSRPETAEIDVPSLTGTGALSAPDGDVFRVLEVLPDSPAAAAGVQVGDAITAIDGNAVSERGCLNDNSLDASIFTFKRGDQIFDRSLSKSVVVK